MSLDIDRLRTRRPLDRKKGYAAVYRCLVVAPSKYSRSEPKALRLLTSRRGLLATVKSKSNRTDVRILNINITSNRLRQWLGPPLKVKYSAILAEGKAVWIAREIYREFGWSGPVSATILNG